MRKRLELEKKKEIMLNEIEKINKELEELWKN
jgi:hypothetical protein